MVVGTARSIAVTCRCNAIDLIMTLKSIDAIRPYNCGNSRRTAQATSAAESKLHSLHVDQAPGSAKVRSTRTDHTCHSRYRLSRSDAPRLHREVLERRRPVRSFERHRPRIPWRRTSRVRMCHCESSGTSLRNRTSPPACTATGTPCSNRTRFLDNALARVRQRVTMPDQVQRIGRRNRHPVHRLVARNALEQIRGLRQRKLLARESADEPPAANFPSRLHAPVHVEELPPRRQAALALQELPEHDAIAAQQHARDVIDRGCAERIRVGNCAHAPRQAPAPGVLQAQERPSVLPQPLAPLL